METLKKWIIFGIMSIGPIIILIYEFIKNKFKIYIGCFKNIDDVAMITATYSVSMLGFISVMVTIVSSFSNRQFMKDYIKDGYYKIYMDVFLVFTITSILLLPLSLLLFSNLASSILLKILFAVFIDNVAFLFILLLININLLRDTSD